MFPTLASGLAIAKSTLGLTTTTRDTELTTLLEASKGVDSSGNTQYRPYIVAAYVLPLWGAVARAQLIKADGAEWLKPVDFEPLIKSLLMLQQASDCGLKIDPCWNATKVAVDLGLKKVRGISGIVA